MRQIFNIGDRVIVSPQGVRGSVQRFEPGSPYQYHVRIDDAGGVRWCAWNELVNEPLSDSVGDMRAGDGVVTNEGLHGWVETLLMTGSYAEHTQNPNDTPRTVVGVRCMMYDGTVMDLVAGHFRRENFKEYLFERPGMFGRWTRKQAAIRYAAMVFWVVLAFVMEFDDMPWFRYALAGFGVAVMVAMTWGHWRNFKLRSA